MLKISYLAVNPGVRFFNCAAFSRLGALEQAGQRGIAA
jgi:hypothetical protein